MKFSAKHFLIGLGAVVALVVLYGRTNRIVTEEHERFDRGLRHIRQVDATLNQDVLKARFHQLSDYDEFSQQLNELKASLEDLRFVPRFTDEKERVALGMQAAQLAQLVEEKRQLLEKFKSQNAVFNNSLSYFPVAGSEMIKRLSLEAGDRELELQFNDLVREVLVYSLDSSEDLAPEILESLKRIDTWRAEHANHKEAKFVAMLSSHARSIVTRKPQVEAVTTEVMAVPVAERTEDLLRLYESQFAKALKMENVYRLFLYVTCAVLLGGIVYTIYRLNAANRTLENRVRERTSDLSSKNEQLQTEVAERKQAEARLEQTHKELIEVSRRAGMAEVATSVLHNVGNVLNSVNVSSSLVIDTMKQSKAARLGEAVSLMNQHMNDLGAYLTTDPKGKHWPRYLTQVVEQLQRERQTVFAELESLRKNIEHIKQIVATQQGYAKVSGVKEMVKVADLLEDALRLNAGGLERYEVRLERQYDDVPSLMIEKHKVLQTLINLVRNAKHACADSDAEDKQVILRVSNGNGHVRISVADNGVGIQPENLTRIFSHGFTTKKDGHGFGLHSGALAAKEMGGSLIAQSEGPGRGAIFTLELPCQNPEDN